MKAIRLLIVVLICSRQLAAQHVNHVSGYLQDSSTLHPIAKASLRLLRSGIHRLTDNNGVFDLQVPDWGDSLSITCIGFEELTVPVNFFANGTQKLLMRRTSATLREVIVGGAGKPAKTFMERVMAKKDSNNPACLQHYTCQQYTKHEIDIDNIAYNKKHHGGFLDQYLRIYSSIDSNAKTDGSLPLYFTEKISTCLHDKSMIGVQEQLVEYRKPGMPTDKLLAKLDKFYFEFNIYEDWIAIFDQSYASPLSRSGFSYYHYVTGDTLGSPTDTLLEIRFTPLHAYAHAFAGVMWISTQTLAVASVGIHLDKTNNLNFIQDIRYTEDYSATYNSGLDKEVYLPASFTSEIYFDNGAALLGIPTRSSPNAMKLMARNSSTVTKYDFGNTRIDSTQENLSARNASLTPHERLIYTLNDSLQSNKAFKRKMNLVAFAGTGYLNINNQFRVGPYFSFISHHPVEGWRTRLGIETLQGISDHVGLGAYIAYGSADHLWKTMFSLKYLWNRQRWTRTRIMYARDYDYNMDQEDEQDADNFINSAFRKPLSFKKIFVQQFQVVHDQWLSPSLSAQVKLNLKTLDPVFGFAYRPINPVIDKPYDSVYAKHLPVAELGFELRYAVGEQNKMIDYDLVHLGTRRPILFANYTYGFETGKAQFVYHAISAGIEQKMALPPKAQLYYRLDAGKVMGALPYLLLHVPAGNEYYVSNRFLYNTMLPYEFAADSWMGFHSRLSLGGILMDKIPGLKKLGWRERFAFNAYYGSLSAQNQDYNKNADIQQTSHGPFMEAGIGIENIFHMLSVEYFRRLSYNDLPNASTGGLYLGMRLVF